MLPTISYRDDFQKFISSNGAKKFPYRKTYAFESPAINKAHSSLLNHPLKPGSPIIDHEIEGWLRPEDAAKLYEMAYFSRGDVVELGTSRGLSTFIMATAIRDAGMQHQVYTVDLREDCTVAATKRLRARKVENVVAETAEGGAWLRKWIDEGKQFDFAFIDHAHTYGAMKDACSLLHEVLAPGAFVAFHDFCDSRNFKGDIDEFGVYPAIRDGLSPLFYFVGAFGCIGLYQLKP